jgi:hypothetical protein
MMGSWRGLGFPLGAGGLAHRPCARPQVPFIDPLTEAPAQELGNVLLRRVKLRILFVASDSQHIETRRQC